MPPWPPVCGRSLCLLEGLSPTPSLDSSCAAVHRYMSCWIDMSCMPCLPGYSRIQSRLMDQDTIDRPQGSNLVPGTYSLYCWCRKNNSESGVPFHLFLLADDQTVRSVSSPDSSMWSNFRNGGSRDLGPCGVLNSGSLPSFS